MQGDHQARFIPRYQGEERIYDPIMRMNNIGLFQYHYTTDAKGYLWIWIRWSVPAAILTIQLAESLSCSLKPIDPHPAINFKVSLFRMFDASNRDLMSTAD
jgi:hypothetical protein